MKIDKNVVFMYSENARMKIKELAKSLRKSSQRIKYSLKVMEKENIIYTPSCIFDYSYFGLILFRVYFKGAYINEKHKSEIIKKLIENEYIVAIYELSGEFELVIEIEAPNPSRLNKILKNIIDLIPTLRYYKTILNLVTYVYPRSYLINDENLLSYVPSQIIIGGDRQLESFNEYDIAVMKNLLNNPKSRMTRLAKQSNINIKTLKLVLQKLYQKNIIRGFKYIINIHKLQIYKFRLFIKLHNLRKEREEDLMNYLLNTKEIVLAHKTVGDWDLELDVESLDKTKIRKITIEMREIFKDIIETFNIMEFYEYYTRSYLPKFYFTAQHSKT